MSQLWRKLVKLFHPDRFAHEPEKQETYHKLTAAINHAKNHSDLATLRSIAEDPHGFILRQGWAALDFGEERELAQLRRLWASIELEIIRVLEAGSIEKIRNPKQISKARKKENRRGVRSPFSEISIPSDLFRISISGFSLAKKIEELTGEMASGIG